MALLSPTLSATKALAERLFAAIDTNANGRLSRVELRAFLLASADESGDPARALLAAELGTAFAASPRKKSSMPPPSMVRQLSDSIDVDGTSGADGSGLGFDEFVYGLTAQLHVRGLLESVGSAGLLEALMHDSGFVEICERFFRARSGCADESKWMFNANELWALFSSHSRLGLSTDEFFQLNEFGQLLNFIFELRGSGSNDGHDKELMKSFFRVSAGVLRAESEVHSPGGRCSLLRHVSDVTESASVARLRIVHVNDVYELGELPSLATLVAQVKAEAAATGATVVCTLGGDFVAPSVLSGLDHGVGMIDCMNQVPFDYVCFGALGLTCYLTQSMRLPGSNALLRAVRPAGALGWSHLHPPSLPPIVYAVVVFLSAFVCHYLSVGNHESDIPMRQLVQRIKESKVSFLLFTVTFHTNLAHNMTRSPSHI